MKQVMTVAKIVLPALVLLLGASILPTTSHTAGLSIGTIATGDGIFGKHGADDPVEDECIVDNRC